MLITSDKTQNLLTLSYNANLYNSGIISSSQKTYSSKYDGYTSFEDVLEYMLKNKASSNDITSILKSQVNSNVLKAFNQQNKTNNNTEDILSITQQGLTMAYAKEMDLNSDGKVTYQEYVEYMIKNSGNSLTTYGTSNYTQAIYGLIDISI